VPKTTNLFFFVSYEGLTHNQTVDYLKNVPTALQKVGDFSQTKTTVSGVPVPIQIFDPYSSQLTGQNIYQRTPVPNNIIPRPDPNALKLMSYFPLPNRTADDQFGANNYEYRPIRTFGKNSVNSRLDYHWGKHSLYGTGGLTRGTITTPGSWGPGNPFYSRNDSIGNNLSDNNPYGAIGDTIVLSPTMVADVRYGLNRIQSNNEAALYPNLDYGALGIPPAMQAINAVPGAAPEFYPGGTFSNLNQTNSLHKRERQTNHQLTGSLTKNSGRWIFKAGSEYRVFLSNYTDAEESFYIITSAEYTRQMTNATGGAIGSPNSDVAGFSPASILFGAGNISVAAGRGVKPAFAQKYFALYSQNDWRATNRLTIFLGLRWDLQPAPTERYNRLSAFDFSATNPYGTNGAYAFPGVGGYSRHLWDTHFRDFGPRVGFGYKLGDRSVLRGGYGISYLPTNTGYFDGPFAYGEDTFSAYTVSDVYGPNPAGVPVGAYYQVSRVVNGTGADPKFPAIYGSGQLPRFDRHNYVDRKVQQWNLVLESRLGHNWQVSASYAGNKGLHLPFARIPLNSNELLPPSLLQSWRDAYLLRNGTGSPATDAVTNPLQPAGGPLIPFNGNQGHATLTLQEALQPWALFGTNFSLQRSIGFSRYDSLQLQLNRRFGNGFQLNANYTWSKSTDFTQTEAQNNGFADTGGYQSTNIDLTKYYNNKKLSLTDVPHRFVATALYELPFGQGKALAPTNRLARVLVSGWKTGGVFTKQSGFPIFVTGANTGAINGRPNRAAGEPLEVPSALQHWYDGKTRVTLPDGRVIQPPVNTFLKYNPDAFAGQVATAANGTLVNDNFWWGTAALDYGVLRDNGRVNFDLSLRRTFRVNERFALDFFGQASNVLNHAEFRPDTTGALGGTNLTVGGTSNLVPGQPQSASFGSYGVATFDPRQVFFSLKLQF
jgi:trimeric autotransporter adhesin